ncbi:MAG: hypothetical protein WBK91_04810 [Alphaproteobacteria bacterium]
MQELQLRIDAIEERDARVAAEVAWEVSWVKRGWIAIVTYFCTALVLRLVDHHDVLVPSLVPVLGYLLVTLAMPHIRVWWLDKFVKDQR